MKNKISFKLNLESIKLPEEEQIRYNSVIFTYDDEASWNIMKPRLSYIAVSYSTNGLINTMSVLSRSQFWFWLPIMESEMAPRETVTGCVCGRCVPMTCTYAHEQNVYEVRDADACLRVNNRSAFETCALLYMQIRQLQPIYTDVRREWG